MSTLEQTATVHPEIPAPAWATSREVDRVEESILDQHIYVTDDIRVRVQQWTDLLPDGPRTLEASALISWTTTYDDGTSDHETVAVRIGDIPRLIAALQRLQAVATR